MGRGRIGGNVVGRQRNGGRRREAENQNKGERRESCHWLSPKSIRNGTAGVPALDAMIPVVSFGTWVGVSVNVTGILPATDWILSSDVSRNCPPVIWTRWLNPVSVFVHVADCPPEDQERRPLPPWPPVGATGVPSENTVRSGT